MHLADVVEIVVAAAEAVAALAAAPAVAVLEVEEVLGRAVARAVVPLQVREAGEGGAASGHLAGDAMATRAGGGRSAMRGRRGAVSFRRGEHVPRSLDGDLRKALLLPIIIKRLAKIGSLGKASCKQWVRF